MSLTPIILAGTVCLVASGLTVQAVRLGDARSALRDARTSLTEARAQATELATLRARSQTRMFGAPPEAALVAAVNQAALETGLPAGTATSISRQPERTARDGAARVQDVRIELGPMTMPELGGFLASWRSSQPAWQTASITIRRPGGRQQPPGTYQATIVCSAEYAPEGI